MPEIPMSEVPGHFYVAPDHCAWTDPMCPEPMAPGSMYCRPHKIAGRRNTVRKLLQRYFQMLGKLDADDRADAAMQLIDEVATFDDPAELVAAAKLGVREMEARAHPRRLVFGTAVEHIEAGETGTVHLGPSGVGCFPPAEDPEAGRG